MDFLQLFKPRKIAKKEMGGRGIPNIQISHLPSTGSRQQFPTPTSTPSNNKQLGGDLSTNIGPLANLVRVNLEVVTRLHQHFHLQSVRGIYILAAFNLLLLLRTRGRFSFL